MGLIQSKLLSSIDGITHGFSDKNLLGDTERIAGRLNLSGVSLLRQVHSGDVVILEAETSERERAEGDAQVTHLSGVGIGVATADCAPILLSSSDGSVVAAVHAGWRGALAEITVNAVRAMKESYGIEPERLKAAIGPCIGRCCYEVGGEVGSMFRRNCADADEYLYDTGSGKFMLDLRAVNELHLKKEGVRDIEILEVCTKCSRDFYSYRGDGGGTGRQLSVIGILS